MECYSAIVKVCVLSLNPCLVAVVLLFMVCHGPGISNNGKETEGQLKFSMIISYVPL